MAGQQGVSLRYKILFVMTSLPLLMLGIYLYVAIQVFKNDKLAYIYDSSSTVARTLSANALTNLNSALDSAKPIMQEFLLRRSFNVISNGVIQVDTPVQWVAVFELPPDGNSMLAKPTGSIERDGVSAQADLEKIQPMKNVFPRLDGEKRVVFNPFRDDRVLIVEKISNDQQAFVFFVLARIPGLVESFRSVLGSESFLTDRAGRVLVAPSGGEDQDLVARLGAEYFAKLRTQKFAAGADSLSSKKGEDLLVSYAKTGFADTFVLALTSKSEAFHAVSTLILRSLIFVGLLISLTVIISLFASSNLTASISALSAATRKVAEGNFEFRVNVNSKDEVGLLAEGFNAMAGEVSRLLVETSEKARMASELSTAKTVQETLFPPNDAKLPGIRISGHYEPASECGGDWWYYSQTGGKVYLWIGDATGHGAPAALITSAARSAATIIQTLDVQPNEAMTLLNRAIYDVSNGGIMMTFFLGCFDPATRTLTYTNASHEAPYLIHPKEGELKKKDLIPLNEVNSPRLGQARETSYEQTSVVLSEGDKLMFYTDGLTDIRNKDDQPWGEREFIKSILQGCVSQHSPQQAMQIISAIFSFFRDGTGLKDDVTFFVAQVEADT